MQHHCRWWLNVTDVLIYLLTYSLCKSQNDDLESEVTHLKSELQSCRTQLVAKWNELGVAESTRSQLTEELDSVRTELQKAVDKISNNDVKLRGMNEEIELLQCEVCFAYFVQVVVCIHRYHCYPYLNIIIIITFIFSVSLLMTSWHLLVGCVAQFAERPCPTLCLQLTVTTIVSK